MRVRTFMMNLVMMAGSIAPQAALADETPPVMVPSSKWQVDYATNECRLMRIFGEGKERTILQLSRYDPNDRIEMLLAGPHIPATERRELVSVATSTVADVPSVRAQGFASTGQIPATLRFQPDVDLPKAFRSDVAAGKPTIMRVNFVRRYKAQFDLGPMKGALAALDQCTDDLIKSWGLDPVALRQATRGPKPIGDTATWFRPDDYPAGAANIGMAGAVIIRLLIGADGHIQNCAITKSGGDKVFQDATCQAAMKRGGFEPAIGADGKPMASVWIQRINWKPGAPFFIVR